MYAGLIPNANALLQALPRKHKRLLACAEWRQRTTIANLAAFPMDRIILHGKTFAPFITAARLDTAMDRVAAEVNAKYADQLPLFIGILNGSYFFAAELLKRLDIACEITFVKVASYRGTVSSGTVAQLIGLNERIANRHVVVVEDIVDTGNTVEHIMAALTEQHPASISIATMLFKKEVYKKDIPIDHVAMEIPDVFVVGSGLDHDGLGRNLPGILQIVDQSAQ